MMKTLIATLLLSFGSLLAGCTTIGTGYGDVETGGSGPVSFKWKSTDGGITGTMSASLSPERSFSGQFFQITDKTQIDGLEPLWEGWNYSWEGWNYSWYERDSGWIDWGPDEAFAFVTHYSGRVLANLGDADGKHMRCRFRLAAPDSGMSGGGSGVCQVAGGEKIDATFPPG